MKIAVISDIHQRHIFLDETFNTLFGQDLTIYLGDYFDNFLENSTIIGKTAEKLKQAIYRENTIFLLGNHDVFYASNANKSFEVSGSTHLKNIVINNFLTKEDWRKFKFVHKIENYIFSHAGIYEEIWRPLTNLKVELNNEECWKLIEQGRRGALLAGSYPRGFEEVEYGHGGCTWMHWEELPVLNNYIQIVGHSIHNTPQIDWYRSDCFNLNMDTNNKHFLLIDTDKKIYTIYKWDMEKYKNGTPLDSYDMFDVYHEKLRLN